MKSVKHALVITFGSFRVGGVSYTSYVTKHYFGITAYDYSTQLSFNYNCLLLNRNDRYKQQQ